ncbi:PREDICTED: protein FAM47E [Chrysochloris asiatica]|uniref:Protein FAM47E n=1 Tax=Chrysochloris asiatica TaxID=185453 RepID=A0A9B0WY91_CHRAS|nr:PREDICTED: protein FAM47E [Chrysochloris asiatica]
MEDNRRSFPPEGQDPVPVGTNCRPRYKENLPSRCFTKPKNRLQVSTSLNSRQWIFVRKGLDDFRKGCPPCEDLITKGLQENFLPRIHHRAPQPGPRLRPNKLPKEAVMFPRLSAAQRVQKTFIEDLEARLTRHPLALYPNLGEDLPVELLLKVLEVLDPDKKLEDTWAYCQNIRKRKKEPTKSVNKPTEVSPGPLQKSPVSHSGKWVYKEKKPSETDLLHGPLLYENGSSNIDEEFILKQFDVDYENKSSYDELHTMRQNQVPVELRCSVGPNKPQELDFSFQELDSKRKFQKPQNPYNPEWVKIRYGAWYLNTKLWKKQRADEPLIDPKILLKAQDENFKKELQRKEDLFEDLYGTVAFMDFILSRGYRMPRFLEKMYIRKKCKSEHNKIPIKQSTKLTEA